MLPQVWPLGSPNSEEITDYLDETSKIFNADLVLTSKSSKKLEVT